MPRLTTDVRARPGDSASSGLLGGMRLRERAMLEPELLAHPEPKSNACFAKCTRRSSAQCVRCRRAPKRRPTSDHHVDLGECACKCPVETTDPLDIDSERLLHSTVVGMGALILEIAQPAHQLGPKERDVIRRQLQLHGVTLQRSRGARAVPIASLALRPPAGTAPSPSRSSVAQRA